MKKEYDIQYIKILIFNNDKKNFYQYYPELIPYYMTLKILFESNNFNLKDNNYFPQIIELMEMLKKENRLSLLSYDLFDYSGRFRNITKSKKLYYYLMALLYPSKLYEEDHVKYYFYFTKIFLNDHNFHTLYDKSKYKHIVIRKIQKLTNLMDEYASKYNLYNQEDIEFLKYLMAYYYMLMDNACFDKEDFFKLCDYYQENKNVVIEECLLNDVNKEEHNSYINELNDTVEKQISRIIFFDNMINSRMKEKRKY